MFGFGSPNARAGVTMLVVVVCLGTSLRSATSVGTAEAFVRTVYDELMAEDLGVSLVLAPVVRDNPQGWDFLPEVLVRLSGRPSQSSEPSDNVLLQISLGIDREGTLRRVRSRGPYVKTAELESMVRFGDEHASWSDESLVAELTRRGGHLARNPEDFETRMRFQRLEPFVGRIESVETEFVARVPNMRVNNKEVFAFEFQTVLRTAPAPGQTAEISLSFEPFSGRLLSLNRALP